MAKSMKMVGKFNPTKRTGLRAKASKALTKASRYMPSKMKKRVMGKMKG